MKSMLDALFLSTYALNSLFVLIKCTIQFIFHIVVQSICEVSQARSRVPTSLVSGCKLLHHTGDVVTSYGTRCYIIRDTLVQQRMCTSCNSYMLLHYVITLLLH